MEFITKNIKSCNNVSFIKSYMAYSLPILVETRQDFEIVLGWLKFFNNAVFSVTYAGFEPIAPEL